MIRFELPMIPVAWARPRAFSLGNGEKRAIRFFTSPKHDQAYRDVIALAAPFAPSSPLRGAIALDLVFFQAITASWPAWRRDAAAEGMVRPTGKPDLSNYVKLVEDALNRSGRWWADDAQVVRCAAEKRYRRVPGILVQVTELTSQITSAAEWRAREPDVFGANA